nr:alpha/beta fold hydrolase [Mycobacterium lehmannii]
MQIFGKYDKNWVLYWLRGRRRLLKDASICVSLLGAETRFVDVDGVRTRTIQAGEGPDLILMHGGGGHAEAFARNVTALSRHFRVHALDLLGHGLTSGCEVAPKRKDYVSHILGYMDQEGIDRAHLVGESLGGWIAAWTALEHPDRVDRLIYVCGARLTLEVGADAEARTAAGRAELARVTRQFLADPSPANVRERMAWLFHHPDRDLTDELVALRWALYQSEESRSALTNATAPPSAATAEDNLTAERLTSLTRPTLVLWTSHNPSATVEFGRRAAELIPGAEFALMEDCGHWPQWERPEEFNQILTNYLQGDRESRGQR